MNASEDPNTASNGGDMGFARESQLKADAELYNAINNLKPDQFTDVIPVYDDSAPGHRIAGYAIYKLISREPAGQRELGRSAGAAGHSPVAPRQPEATAADRIS